MYYLIKSERIDYDYIGGHNDTVIFLHGWGGDKHSFRSTINILKQNYNILSVTLPTIYHTVSIWQLRDYAETILTLMKLYNITNPIIICHSFGFRVCSYMNAVGIKIKKVIITGGAGIKKDSLPYSNFKTNKKFENILKHIKNFKKLIKNHNFIKKIKENNRKTLLKNKKYRFLFNKIASKDYLNLSSVNRETFKNIVNFNTLNLIQFYCPLMLFWGKKDKETPLNFGKYIKNINKNVFFTSKFGHFAYIDDNIWFNHEVVEFLK